MPALPVCVVCWQYVRTGKFTTACEMWSVGCVMLEMTTGHPPWPKLAELELGPLMYQVVALVILSTSYFLANRWLLAWYCRVCLSVMLCIVAERYILQQKCPNKWIGSAVLEHDFSTFNPIQYWPVTISAQKLCRVMFLRKSCTKAKRNHFVEFNYVSNSKSTFCRQHGVKVKVDEKFTSTFCRFRFRRLYGRAIKPKIQYTSFPVASRNKSTT